MVSPLTPLAWNVPIVDDKGNPTPYFQRMLQQLLQEKDALQDAVDLTAGIDIIAGTGLDGGGPLDGSGDVTLNLEDTAVTADTYGDASNYPVITVDAQGRLTAASELALPVGGGGGAWVLAGTGQTTTGVYDFAVDGAKTNIDFVGLGSYNELLVIARNLTTSASGLRLTQVSVDNGATFYSTSGNYKTVTTAGVESNDDAIAFHSTATTAARTLITHIINLKGTEKFCFVSGFGLSHMFTASASDINAIRVSNNGGGNITGGTVRVFAR